MKGYIITILLFGLILGGLTVSQRLEVKRLQADLIQVRTDYVELWEEDSTALVKKAKIVEDLRALRKRDIKIMGEWKSKFYEIFNATQETIIEDGSKQREKVSFDTSDICINFNGYTLTNPPYLFFEYDLTSIDLSLELVRVKEDLEVGKITSSNPCYVVRDIEILAPPLTVIKRNSNKWLWYGLGTLSGLVFYKYVIEE